MPRSLAVTPLYCSPELAKAIAQSRQIAADPAQDIWAFGVMFLDIFNVSLFHYRNHGADIGRVLVGLQVPPEEQPQLQSFLDRVGYVCYPETDNAVYKQFLR